MKHYFITGTRVALAQGNGEKFGTVRCYSTTTTSSLQSVNTTTQVRAGTVRVTSSSRPSILPSTPDPYDLMRRSRLNSTNEVTPPLRGRSVSPKRNNVLTSSGSEIIMYKKYFKWLIFFNLCKQKNYFNFWKNNHYVPMVLLLFNFEIGETLCINRIANF